MRIVAYVQPTRTVGRVSGVGKHIGQMPPALATLGADVKLLTARDRPIPFESPLTGMPASRLPLPARLLEWAWTLTGTPAVDRWADGADWVYCPAENYVPYRGGRIALTAHASDWAEPDLPWVGEWRYRRLRCRWNLVYRTVRRRRALVLAVSEFLRSRLIDRVGLAAKCVVTVGNGVEDEFFNAQATPPAAMPYAIAIGGLTRYKGGDRLLAVARAMRGRLRFVSVGGDSPDLAAEADALGNVERRGYVGVRDGLPELMAGAIALVNLSRYETFGIPAAEALAAGVPAIVVAGTALPEVVGDAGIVVEPDRTDDVVRQLSRMVDEPSYREDWIARGRNRAARFRWSAVAARVLSALD